jgi:tetraacyldisaccharide 4'-kinase
MGLGLTARIEAAWTTGGALAQALRPLGALHAALVALRHRLYRWGWKRSERLDVPVIVIGNRVVGGAGKTPTTLALVQALREAGWHPGIVSRGHGGRASAEGAAPTAVGPDSSAVEVGDEPLLLQRRSGVPLWIGRQRAAAGRALRQAHPEVDVIVCDDGLQHLRLARDFEVIVFDERGAGNGRLLPAGPLREPIDAPSHARRSWLLYNAAQPSTALPGPCATRVLTDLLPLADWWRGAPAAPDAVARLRGHPVIASAGLGQPQRFFDGLSALGLTVQPWPLPDHFDYAELPWRDDSGPIDVIVTEKDAVKLRPERLAAERPALRLWVAPLAFELPRALVDELLQALAEARRA